ncbi:MAG: EAL domain-containing protein [Desulfosudaceae bacterium]
MNFQESDNELHRQINELKEEAWRYRQAEKVLSESEERYRLIVEQSQNAIFILGDSFRFIYANQQFCRLTGYSHDEFIDQDFRAFLKVDQRYALENIYLLRRQGQEAPDRYDFTFTDKAGQEKKVEIRASTVSTDHGQTLTIGFLLDITDRKQAEEALRQSEKRYRLILEEIQDAYYEVDYQGNFTFMNQQMCNLLGYPENELLGKNNRDYMDESNARLVYHTFNHVFHTGEPSSGFDWKLICKDGSKRWVNASISLIKDEAGNRAGFRGIVRDITRQKEMEKELHRMAYYDALTGVANRSLLNERFHKAIARAYRYNTMLAVLVVDMNRTKEINDTLGHSAGDELIQGVARRLKESVRESDTVARTGGDEFVILGEGIETEAGALALGEKLLRHVNEKPFLIHDNRIFQEISVGFSLYPHDGLDKDTLLKQADVAMYHAKEYYSKTPHRYSSHNDLFSSQFALAQDLRQAVDKNEFTIFYQPQVDLQTFEVIGMEALLRWKHPRQGYISPSEFIPILERTGQIRSVGLRVEKSVCRQISRWKQNNQDIPQGTINCCVYELSNPTMLDELLGTIKEYNIDPSQIGIEITERVAAKRIEDVRQILQALSDLGITILLDDFGTGYSSLSLLQQLPIDIVKIDKSFIHAMFDDQYSASLVRAIITMCHETDKKVMAEGIETEKQLAYLQSLGCDYGQGFLFGRPAPQEEFRHQATFRPESIKASGSEPGSND